MRLKYSTTLIEVENELKQICKQAPDSIKTFKSIKKCLEQKATEINSWLRNYEFESEDEEIYFFKNIKAELLAKIIVTKFKIDIILNLPNSKKAIPDYYNKLIDKHSQIPKKQYYLYKYYRNESTYHDKEYFLRKYNDTQDNNQYQFLFFDERITTKMEYPLSEIIAKQKIIIYLENKLEELNNSNSKNIEVSSNLNWTATKVDLTELIYALHLQKAINNGEVELKEVAMQLCKTFNIKYDDSIYRHYTDIKRRKTDTKAKFIQSLSNSLNNKILQEEY
jgi:hypothetical protein